MALPFKPDAKRMCAEWSRFEIDDPSFERPVIVYLRPLLDIEIDKADASRAEFVAHHVTGGFYNEVTEEFQKEPLPLMVQGLPVELTDNQAVAMHRYEAMQKPMVGQPPMPADGTFVSVLDMAQSTVTADEFWRGLQDAAGQVWRDARTGKAWGRAPAGSTSQPPA